MSIGRHAGRNVDVIHVTKLQLPDGVIASDIWGAPKAQPALVSIELVLSKHFDSAAAADSLDDSTIHYGHLCKNVRSACTKAQDLRATMNTVYDAISALATKDNGKRFILSIMTITLILPKASAHGGIVEVIFDFEYDSAGKVHLRTERLNYKQLHVMTLIGVNAQERTAQQLILLSSSLITDTEGLRLDDSTVTERAIVHLVQNTAYETLETLANYVMSGIIELVSSTSNHIQRIHLKLEKPSAVVYADAPAIELQRQIDITTLSPRHTYNMASIAEKVKDALPIQLKSSNGAHPTEGRHHGKSQSHVAFENTSTSVAASQMRNALNTLTDSVKDPKEKQRFETEMDNFFALFRRYLNDKAKGNEIDWHRIAPPKPEQVVDYNSLGNTESVEFLSKLAVLKLNGGLGTSMGCVGPKSVIEVRDGMSFLDLSVRQIEYLNKTYDVNVPFVLMNSFNTDADTANIIKKYEGHNIDILTFNQSRYPRILKDSLLPAPKSADSQISDWYPPGHGDVFESLYNSGILDKLLERGVEIVFLSNADNLGAVVDLNILHHMVETRAEYIMELTDKTKADVKGGTIIDYEGQARLLEIAQVPKQYVNEFKSIKKFKYFNTNNIWMNLRAVKRVVENNELAMEIIPNGKSIPADKKGEADVSIIQLETAVGAAIRHFNNAHGVNVPRRRFLPVKTCSDLMLVKSDLYTLKHGQLVMDPNRFGPAPLIKLGNDFKKVSNFQSRIPSIPKILELDHLTITGAVNLGRGVVLKGTVIIVATEGSTIDVPPGSILENVVVQGSLRLLEH